MSGERRERPVDASECLDDSKPVYSDNRFQIILERISELNSLLNEIDRTTCIKLNDLLGISPAPTDPEKKEQVPDCWVEVVIADQDRAITTSNEILRRLTSL